jgi:hypothetical protein
MAKPIFPLTAVDFLDELERRFPERLHQPGVTVDELWFSQGQRDVVTTMRGLFNLATKKDSRSDVPGF